MSNFYCHPGRAGGTPGVARIRETQLLRPSRSPAQRRSIVPSAILAAASFLAALLVLWLLLFRAELLVRLGLEGQIFYVALLPLGLVAASCLFGVLRSYAAYRGKVLGGVLELGGPVVVFALVVVGGHFLVPSTTSFAVTIFVHGEGGVQDVPLRNKGVVVVDLGGERRREAIGPKGEVHLAGIPANFAGQEVPVWVEAEGFAPASPIAKQRLAGPSLYLAVKHEPITLLGRVEDIDGRPISGASIRLRDLAAQSKSDGSFSLDIPARLLEEELTLRASAPGYQPWSDHVVPRSNEVVAVLRRSAQ